jgi:glutathione S-transferase
MKLYGTPPTRALRALWLINELGLECEIISVDMSKGQHLQAEFLALNPAGKVPVLVDGDMVLTESVAMTLYLAEKCPDKGLIPDNLIDRAQMYRWLFFLVTEIEAPLWRIARHTSIYPEEKRLPEDVKLARQEAKVMLEVLENHLQGRQYLAGERLSVADLVAAYTLDWANTVKLMEKTPRLQEYLRTMYERPAAPCTIAAAFAAMGQK